MLEKGSTHTTKTRRSFTARLLFTVVFAFALCGIAPLVAHAQLAASVNAVQTVAGAAGVSAQTDLLAIVGRVIYIALSLVGVVLLGIILYAGYQWMTAGGDADKVKSAQAWIRNAVIGVFIVMASFAITNFILGLLAGTAQYGGVAPIEHVGGVSFPSSAGSLGGGIIEYHVPMRDATGVPRNTGIAIAFKQPIDPASLIEGYAADASSTGINSNVIKIFPTAQPASVLASADVRVRFTPDRKMFVFKPVLPLGSPMHNTAYTVRLMAGATGLKLADGRPAFSGGFSDGYIWSFEVSTLFDNTPPRITSVIPREGNIYAPNVMIQINFSEAIDPTSASGVYDDTPGSTVTRNFQNIEVRATPVPTPTTPTVSRPSGEFKMSNRFATVEFIPNVPCGQNSCGRTIYCLPFNSSVDVVAKAATLDGASTIPQAALTTFGYDGIVDMAGNSLDGNGDGRAQGSNNDDAFAVGNDNYEWAFGTNGEVSHDPPLIRSTVPGLHASRVPVDQSPTADFNDVLQAATVNSDNIYIRTNEPSAYNDTFWFTPFQAIATSTGAGGTEITFGRTQIDHRVYVPATTFTPDYDPYLTSGIQNIYQNCFTPAGSSDCHATVDRPYCCDSTTPSALACTPTLPPPLTTIPTAPHP